jgi:hypothetical protein
MKEKIIIFAIVFTGSCALSYFLRGNRDIQEMIFVYGGAAAIVALASGYTKRFIAYIINKVVKQKSH